MTPLGRTSRCWFAAALLAALPTAAAAISKPDVTLPELAASAARVVRGACLSASVETVALAGARIPTTIYEIRVDEYLKGAGARTLRFRQVGTPEGGSLDLGWLAGLPTYAPGRDYVWFLLPESRAGLTSPAGAGDGAFEIDRDRVIPMSGAVRDPALQRDRIGITSMPYTTLRQAVRGEARR